jgi:uncharacterized membrane protein
MTVLVLGLALFVLAHSVAMVPGLRPALVDRLGDNGHRSLYTAVSAVGLVLVVWGFGLARAEGAPAWFAHSKGMRHATLLFALPVFPLIVAAFVPGAAAIRARVGHPMLTGVILWAFAHLLFVGSAPAVVLFTVFFVWGIADRLSLARRSGPRPTPLPAFGRGDALAIVIGLAVYGVVLWKAHLWLIGVSPLG